MVVAIVFAGVAAMGAGAAAWLLFRAARGSKALLPHVIPRPAIFWFDKDIVGVSIPGGPYSDAWRILSVCALRGTPDIAPHAPGNGATHETPAIGDNSIVPFRRKLQIADASQFLTLRLREPRDKVRFLTVVGSVRNAKVCGKFILG